MKLVIRLTFLLITTVAFSQTTFVPDDNFEAYLEANGAGNGIANDNLASTIGMQSLPFLNIQNQNIADLTGIEVMTNLFTVIANGNTFTSLDVSNNPNLNTIIANNNPNLTTFVTAAGNNIRTLNLSNSGLTQLDTSLLLNLETLDASNNMIASLDLISNGMLDNVYVQNNALTFLNVANGDNGNILDFNATGNSDLTCINVDDASAGYLAAWQKDTTASFGEHCYDTMVPDDNFEAYLETHDDTGNIVPLGSNRSMGNGIANDDHVRTSRISGVTSLNISSSMIADITGIEDFAALEILDFSGNGVGNFDLSNNGTLKELYCASNGMSNFNIAANINLEIFDCSDNSNLTIDVSSNINLKELNAANNGTTSLVLGTISSLEKLNLANNNIPTIDFSNLSNLTDLDLDNNFDFNVSDYSPLANLVNLNVDQTSLTSINLSTNVLLETLSINFLGGLTLDLSYNTALTSLSAQTSDLTSLNIQNGNNANITFFDARFNELSCIQVDNPAASYLSTWLKDANTSFGSDCSLTSILDVNFEYHLENHDANGNVVAVGSPNSMGNGILDDGLVLTSRISGVTYLDISGNSIDQLDGLEAFTALEILICSENNFNEFDFSQLPLLRELTMSDLIFPILDLSSNLNLEKLIYNNANSTSLNIGNNTMITELNIGNNNIGSFDFAPYTTLEILNLSGNMGLFESTFTTLSNLKELNVNGVGILSLNLSNNLLLESLALDEALGFNLDLSSNTALTSLSARNAELSGINIQNGNNANITYFDAEQNSTTMNCIQVDDPNASYLNTWDVDSNVVFTLDCSLTNIPNANFENYLETHDADGDSVPVGDPMSLGNGIANDNKVFTYRVASVTSLDISNLAIGQFIGIEDFIALEHLDCNGNSGGDLDLSNAVNLLILDCSGNDLEAADFSNNTQLTTLDCSSSTIGPLDLGSNTNLVNLDISDNPFIASRFDVSGLPNLEILNASNIGLTSIDFSVNTNLKTLNISNNSSLVNLNVSNNLLLESLQVDGASGFALDLSNNIALTSFSANNSDLSSLNMQNGNNDNVTYFDARLNVFNCIQVDDTTAPYLVMWQKDADTFFSQDCRQTYVPDDNFENYLETHDASGNTVAVGDATSMGNGIANDDYVSTTAIETVTSLSLFSENVADMTGIQDFTALTNFVSYENDFTTLDVTANTNLESLNCSLTPINSLITGNNTNLMNLSVFNTALATLDISQCPNLEVLSCSFTPLANLDLTANTKLKQIFADETSSLTNIDLTGLSDLTELRLDNSAITSLDITTNTALEELRMQDVSVGNIDLSNNTALRELFASNTSLNSLDVSNNTSLQFLGVSNNAISILDLSQNIALTSIFTQNNSLTYLNLKNGVNTNITSINITGNPNLTCVLVDNDNYADANFTNKDVQTIYNEDSCGQTLECPINITVEENGSCEATINAPTPTVYGDRLTAGTALNFDGIDDRLTVSSGFTNDLNEVTIEAKVYFDTIDNWDAILNYTNWSTGYLHYQLNTSGNLGWSVNGNSPTDHYVDLGLQTHTWYNLAVSYSATDKVVRFYLNGVLQATRSYTTALPLVANRQFIIGAWNSNRFLDGAIDDFRIWNTVRTETEIQSNLDIPLSGNESGLIAYYNFNEGQACADNSSITTINDLTGNYNATLNNFDLSGLTFDCSSNFTVGTIQEYLLVNNYNNSSILNETFPVGTTNVTWTWTWTDAQNQMSQCMQTIIVEDSDGSCNEVALSPKVFLQGALLNPNTGEESWMRDDLRNLGLIPTTSPYDMSEVGGIVFMTPGENAIVDWVKLELRDATNNSTIIAETSALLQRDGDVVSLDGFSPITIAVGHDDYFVVIKHKNHLGIMTSVPIALTNIPTTIDFTDATNQITFGSNAQTTSGMPSGIVAMWSGNVNADTVIQYSGTTPDTPAILSEVLNDAGNFLNFPTFAVNGYNLNDVNMDGIIQYSGTNPDTPFILQNILAHPGNFLNFSTYQIVEQLPTNE
ncbi:LamG-like jellyroll fold domain-containing protein [Kordia sp.]|uniref:LamG-like jellyroll fold domain-containing protein n=1 Tax=Kordia sp. TaxID=1965332 RepID=UPI003B5CC447